MIGAGIAGQTLATAVLGGQIWRDDRKVFLESIRWLKMREGIVRYKKFPLLNTGASLMNTAAAHLTPLILVTFFSSAIVGFFALGHKLLSMPMSLIGGSIAQVFFQRAAVAKCDGNLPFFVGNTLMKLMSLGLFPIMLVMVIGKEIFSVIFGIQWAEAGVYAQILAPWIMIQFISSPISTLFAVLEMQGAGLMFNAVLLVTRVAALMIGGFLNSILISLTLFSVAGAVLYLFLCLFLLKKSGLTMAILISGALQMGIIAFIALFPVVILKGIGAQSLTTVIAGCLSVIIYYVILYFRDEELRKLVAGFLCGPRGFNI
jgi:O-antigen/teichoic acid export membrane protein